MVAAVDADAAQQQYVNSTAAAAAAAQAVDAVGGMTSSVQPRGVCNALAAVARTDCWDSCGTGAVGFRRFYARSGALSRCPANAVDRTKISENHQRAP